jgi:mannobiose 2-epimerase
LTGGVCIEDLSKRATAEVKNNILPFWEKLIDAERGGFYGEADFYGAVRRDADKGCILNSRILWTFSSAARIFKDESYLPFAKQAFEALVNFFWDKREGGLFWLTDAHGTPLDTKKHFYNHAFGLYALSEYYRTTGVPGAKEYADKLFRLIGKFGYDAEYGGYIDACDRNWTLLSDGTLGPDKTPCAKTMNTNLHILEALTCYARIEPSSVPVLEKMITVMMERIISDKNRFQLYFTQDWKSLTGDISYGHDIEGSWLLYEAAEAAGNAELLKQARARSLAMAAEVLENGLDEENGGLLYERAEDGSVRQMKSWWPQAEAVVGFYNAWELSQDEKYLQAAESVFDYIDRVFADHVNGDWHSQTDLRNNTIPLDKVDAWKCPYHNGRMCFELVERSRKR